MIGTIYKYTNKHNGRIYIGKTLNLRLRKTQHKCATFDDYFHRAIRKHGYDAFDLCVIEQVDGTDRHQLNERLNEIEIACIAKHKAEGHALYNCTEGGEGVVGLKKPCRESTRLKKCKTVYQYDLHGNFIQKFDGVALAARTYGVRTSSVSSCLRGRILSCCGFMWSFDYSETIPPYYRRPIVVSEARRESLRIRNKGNKWCVGRPMSEETKRKLKIANSERVISDETRKRMSISHSLWRQKKREMTSD